jgi:hypothetical protein
MPGVECPVCDQLVKLTMRKLHSGMAYALVRLYRWNQDHPREFMDYRDRRAQGESRNHPYLRFWGLVESHALRRGFWRITEHGQAFVEGRVRVPRAIWHFNNSSYGFTPDDTSLRRALGDHFDWDELMSRAWL